MHRLSQLVHLHRLGTGTREVARLLGMSPTTEREYRRIFESAGLLSGCPEHVPSNDELSSLVLQAKPPVEHRGQQSHLGAESKSLIALKHSEGAKPTAIFDWLSIHHPRLAATKSAVKRYVATLTRHQPPQEADVVIPVETLPGQIAQVDFGNVGKLFDEASATMREAYVFVMTLGHSRHAFYRIVFDQRVETWLALHLEAFKWFGGVPRTVVPDNLKSAVVRAAFNVKTTPDLNVSYRDFARHHGFLIDPTPPYQPQKKGKVEAGVKYVKGNFFATVGEEKNARILNHHLDVWAREVAGKRRHGTTLRRPIDAFEEEKKHLKQLPLQAWSVVFFASATVRSDAHCLIDGALYSVPWTLLHQVVNARIEKNQVTIFANDTRVATHRRVARGQRCTVDEHLPESRRAYRQRSIEHWRGKALEIGPVVAMYVEEVIACDAVLSPVPTVIAMVSLLAKVAPERAQAACKRASSFGCYRYNALKYILDKGLESKPLGSRKPSAQVANPKFARPTTDFLEHREAAQ